MPSLMRYINIISRCGNIWRGDKLKDSDLGPGKTVYILALCHTPGVSQEQLARRICIDKSNVTRHLAALEKCGYVERRQSEEDRRVTLVYPTEKAYDILPYIREITREWNQYLTEDFTEEELTQLYALLGRLYDKATTYARREPEDDPADQAFAHPGKGGDIPQ